MKASLVRIRAVLLRYFILHTRSLPRTLEIFFWPVMELLVWGFVTVYFKSMTQGTLGNIAMFLINAMIFWDILYRSQQAVSIAFVEDMWTQNIVNILVSPLKLWEWLLATFLYGAVKIGIITALLGVIAYFLYQFNLIGALGFYLIPLVANLLFFGWALGVFTSGLMIRYGHSAEALIWGIPYLIQPLSAIYYPLSVLPKGVQVISKLLPSTYVFEGMREASRTGSMPLNYFFAAFALNLIYFILAGIFFRWMYAKARETGRLGRLGMD